MEAAEACSLLPEINHIFRGIHIFLEQAQLRHASHNVFI